MISRVSQDTGPRLVLPWYEGAKMPWSRATVESRSDSGRSDNLLLSFRPVYLCISLLCLLVLSFVLRNYLSLFISFHPLSLFALGWRTRNSNVSSVISPWTCEHVSFSTVQWPRKSTNSSTIWPSESWVQNSKGDCRAQCLLQTVGHSPAVSWAVWHYLDSISTQRLSLNFDSRSF